jgi:tetratricopeptide (TPR) repeat protein
LSILGDVSKATAACDRSKALFSEIGDHAGEAGVWGRLAFQAANQGDVKGGRMANERQIALLKKIEYVGGLGYAMTVAGELSADSGDYQRALGEYKEALELYQRVGYQSGVISSYGNIGWVSALQGNLAEAVKNDEQAIALTRLTNSKGESDLWLVDLVDVLLDKGDIQGAAKHLERGFEINNETGDKRAATYLHTSRSKLLFAEGRLDESRREAELAIKLCLELNDEGGANQRRLLLTRLDIAENRSQATAGALRKALSSFESKRDGDSQIETRALLIEALLTMPSHDSKGEIALLAKLPPVTQNASLRLFANLQIARARFVLGDKTGAQKLLAEVISESKRMGYESLLLEAELTSAEAELQSGDSSVVRSQIGQITKQAEARGLVLLVNKARTVADR